MLSDHLNKLSELRGIIPSYYDNDGVLHTLTDAQKISLLQAMGDPVSDSDPLESATRAIESRLESRLLDSVIVTDFRNPGKIDCRIPASDMVSNWSLEIVLEGGIQISTPLSPRSSDGDEESEIRKCFFELPPDLPPGYHSITLRSQKISGSSVLILCPSECYVPVFEKALGLSVQMYALNSETNFGIGDFADLMEICGWASSQGFTVVGINPIHSLFPSVPTMRSPYYPSSRYFYNPLCLSVRMMDEWSDCEGARSVAEEFEETLRAEKKNRRIEYAFVSGVKFRLFRLMFEHFFEREYSARTERGNEFRAFLEENGSLLMMHCAYEAIYSQMVSGERYGWRSWPAEFQKADSGEIKEYIKNNEKEVLFYAYLQWNCSRQLERVISYAIQSGVRLYLDVAVGASPDGSEVWSNPGLYSTGANTGAPPDAFSASGQDWGIAPFIPHALKDHAYHPFIEMLRKNMPRNGIVRIDHVMALYRLFWVLRGKSAADGGYVKYPFKDLLNILSLESHRQKCMVIGEDLGTVPDEVRDELRKREIFSWKVLYFEKDGDVFRDPARFPPMSVATLNTHDLPTFAGFWKMTDIAERERLAQFSAETAAKQKKDRELDKSNLLQLLGEESENEKNAHAGNGQDLASLCVALNKRLAGASSRVVLYSLHDLLLDDMQPNLPGTVDEYPCWALRYPETIEQIKENKFLSEFSPATLS